MWSRTIDKVGNTIKQVRHKVLVMAALKIQEGLTAISTVENPAIPKLQDLDDQSQLYCQVLADHGYDGTKL
jgi:hypothetical protein